LLDNSNMNINNIPNVKIVPYIYNMEEVLNAIDLVVCRSGAMTITEVAVIGKPAIFIPFPYATENHQEYNAKVLQKVGAAKIILDKNLNANLLNECICKIVKDKNLMQMMAKNANKLAVNNVENRIYQEVKNVIKLKE